MSVLQSPSSVTFTGEYKLLSFLSFPFNHTTLKSVLRPHRNISHRWLRTSHKLSLSWSVPFTSTFPFSYTPQRRLRRPWPLQRRNNITPYLSQTSLPRQSPINPWQSRIKGCNSSQPPLIHVCGAPLSLKSCNLDLWVLYGVCPQIRLITCMDLFHRHVRLLNPVRRNR